MKLNEIFQRELSRISLSDIEEREILSHTKFMVESLEKNLIKKKINAEVFVGGSLAKKTLIKKKIQDVDVFIRFDKSEDIEKLSSCFSEINGKLEKVHGSRDYFRLKFKEIIFEIVPVLKVSKPENAENITDLSYFHVSYVTKEIRKNPKLKEDIKLAKSFCYAQNCYGAESYIRGFSGYSLELLVIHYGGFLKFLKSVAQIKDKVVIDPSKFYKNKNDVLESMNESKLDSPIIFVDPTFKQRNALAALSYLTFYEFRDACQKFLKNPNLKYFEEKEVEEDKLIKYAKKRKLEFLKLIIKTDRQEGDIAGTKLYKFYNFLLGEIGGYFKIVKKEFVYNHKQVAIVYLILKSEKEILRKGPPIANPINLAKFKKKYPHAYIKDHKAFAKIKIDFTGKKFIDILKKKYRMVIREMGIVKLDI